MLEYTAFAEPVGARTLSALVSEGAVLAAEERGLIRVVVEGRREVARLGHPLYGEVAREHCPELRRRRRHAELVRVVEAAGLRRREDLLRTAVWRLESGLGADPEPLAAASRLAWSAHDYRLAVRLAEAAVTAGGGTGAAILLATVLDYAQLPDRARAVLDTTPEPEGEAARAELALARANNLAWGMNRLAEAKELLDATERELREPGPRGQIAVRRLTLTASAAQPREALALSAPLLRPGARWTRPCGRRCSAPTPSPCATPAAPPRRWPPCPRRWPTCRPGWTRSRRSSRRCTPPGRCAGCSPATWR
ncbi:hypothetical protein [Thermocatellispora tengchongensis]|uniref:hypothetical protein n=1 Tax=Thermocatellispora tengchongensis TaxID=1073253 RepID=UPI003636E7C1